MKIGRCMLIALAAGCGAADATDTERAPLPPNEAQGQRAAPMAQETAADTRCPLALPGAQVASEVTSDGVALVFRVAGGDPTDLRDRVQRMADRHNAAQVPGDGVAGKDQKGGMTSGATGQGSDMHGGAKSVPSRAVVEETAGGARIIFTPADPAQIGLLREQIRVHGKEMATTGCAADEAPTPQAPPPSSSGDSTPAPKPTPSPKPADPILPDRPVTPDQPVTPPAPPPPPTGEPFVQ
jgi:hypothetical protein